MLVTFSDIFEKYDVLLVDIFGVIWDGVSFIPGALDALQWFVESGKIVVILSNASVSANQMLRKYSTSMHRGVHFSEFVTSGEVLNNLITNRLISFKNIKNPKTYAILGSGNSSNF